MQTISDSEKLRLVLEALGETANSFSIKLGYKSHQSVYHVLKGENNFSSGMKERALQKFPNINANFLNKNEFPVLLDAKETQMQMNVLNLVDQESQEFILFKRFMALPDQLDRIEENQMNILKMLEKYGK